MIIRTPHQMGPALTGSRSMRKMPAWSYTVIRFWGKSQRSSLGSSGRLHMSGLIEAVLIPEAVNTVLEIKIAIS
jgi:hypothetical protein